MLMEALMGRDGNTVAASLLRRAQGEEIPLAVAQPKFNDGWWVFAFCTCKIMRNPSRSSCSCSLPQLAPLLRKIDPSVAGRLLLAQ